MLLFPRLGSYISLCPQGCHLSGIMMAYFIYLFWIFLFILYLLFHPHSSLPPTPTPGGASLRGRRVVDEAVVADVRGQHEVLGGALFGSELCIVSREDYALEIY